MSKNNGNMTELGQQSSTAMIPTMEVKAVKAEDRSNDSERRAELYELIKDHPLAGLIGVFEECNAEDVSMNVHKYIGEYHAERHARQSN